MSCSTKFFRASFGTVALVGFTWLLLVGILKNGRTSTITTLNIRAAAGNLKGVEIMGRDQKKLAVHPDQTDLNYMSKRRVPNGPDPIHNRRAGNSRQPPGQA